MNGVLYKVGKGRMADNTIQQEILRILQIASFFDSGFTEQQIHAFMTRKASIRDLRQQLQILLQKGKISYKGNVYILPGTANGFTNRQRWSRKIYQANRKYLQWMARLPWVRYIGLTGANAFESCNSQDDVDLFIITAKKRLWLVYLLVVIVSRLLGVREQLCVNYLVDEANLSLDQQNYYTAIQIVQMKSVINHHWKQRFVDHNPWLANQLPNACMEAHPDATYYFGQSFRREGREGREIFSLLNRWVYRWYRSRLQRKFPEQFGTNIILSEGFAKLNRIDYQEIYEIIGTLPVARENLKTLLESSGNRLKQHLQKQEINLD